MLSTVFEGARIYDGNGAAPYVTDVAIVEDRIALIGDLRERDAIERIPCAGLALAPGFIDVHSHSDILWLVDPRCEGKIRQGVTTEIGGNCGASPAPLVGKRTSAHTFNATHEIPETWETYDDFMRLVDSPREANIEMLLKRFGKHPFMCQEQKFRRGNARLGRRVNALGSRRTGPCLPDKRALLFRYSHGFPRCRVSAACLIP